MAEMNFVDARQKMIANQIRANRVTDPMVIRAMEILPREAFVPRTLRGTAYRDKDLSVSSNDNHHDSSRRLMEPMVLARLLQLAQIKSTDIVLDIGCATGYSAGVLAYMAATVIALESDLELAKTATTILEKQGIDNVVVIATSLIDGYLMQAPYNVIVFEGAISAVPKNIRSQLAEDGRLVAMLRGDNRVASAILITHTGQVFSRRTEFEGSAALLPGFEREPEFVFG